MESTEKKGSKFRRYQLGALASLVLAGLCIFAPITPEMSSVLKWTYIVSGFFVFLATINLYSGYLKIVAPIGFGLVYFALFSFSFSMGFLENELVINNESAVNIVWLVLLFFTSGAFAIFSREISPDDESHFPIFVLNKIIRITIILWIVMLIAVIVKIDSIINFFKIAFFILYSIEFFLARGAQIIKKRLNDPFPFFMGR